MNDLQYRRFMDIPVLITQRTYAARYCALSASSGLLCSTVSISDLLLSYSPPVARFIFSDRILIEWERERATIPSNNRLTPCVNSLPIHLIANALKICPCATSSTSPHGAFCFPSTGEKEIAGS